MVGVHTNLLAAQVEGKLACVLQKKQLVEEKNNVPTSCRNNILTVDPGFRAKNTTLRVQKKTQLF
jgi:hypothetical protein